MSGIQLSNVHSFCKKNECTFFLYNHYFSITGITSFKKEMIDFYQ